MNLQDRKAEALLYGGLFKPFKPKTPYICVNLARRGDRRLQTWRHFRDVHDLTFFPAVDGSQLEPSHLISDLFQGNDFGSRRGVVGCALSHLLLWMSLLLDKDNDSYTIYEDDVTLEYDYLRNYKGLLIPDDAQVVFLGYTGAPRTWSGGRPISYEVLPLDRDQYVGGTFAYLIHKKGAATLLDYINKEGIKHGIDYLMKICPGLVCYEVSPHLAVSAWCKTLDSEVDSDVQKDLKSIEEPDPDFDLDWYPGLDSPGHDLLCLGKIPVSTIDWHARQNPKCVAYNTLGFLKSEVGTLVKSPYFGDKDGIYIIRPRRPTSS